jgi:CRP-like cAMP-binding protein
MWFVGIPLKSSSKRRAGLMQLVACNRIHDIEERLASRLLMTQEQIGGENLPLTQEFLEQMLGIRRASVTVAAGILQKAGMISYR